MSKSKGYSQECGLGENSPSTGMKLSSGLEVKENVAKPPLAFLPWIPHLTHRPQKMIWVFIFSVFPRMIHNKCDFRCWEEKLVTYTGCLRRGLISGLSSLVFSGNSGWGRLWVWIPPMTGHESIELFSNLEITSLSHLVSSVLVIPEILWQVPDDSKHYVFANSSAWRHSHTLPFSGLPVFGLGRLPTLLPLLFSLAKMMSFGLPQYIG